jgi:hypothetical protein
MSVVRIVVFVGGGVLLVVLVEGRVLELVGVAVLELMPPLLTSI